MKNLKLTHVALTMLTALFLLALPLKLSAQTTDFKDLGDPRTNGNALNALIAGDEEKTININSDIQIDSVLRPGSNTTINAGNHNIEMTMGSKGLMANVPQNINYSAISNLTINGGTWFTAGNDSNAQTMIRLAHGNNIHFNNVTIVDGYEDHAVELIACKDVTFYGCKFSATGTCPANCLEEQLQIDLADKFTAPGIERECGPAFVNGAPSFNIYINSCVVNGARGICANFAARNAANRKAGNYHRGITVTNCKITGRTSEALSLFNTVSANVSNNTIITYAPLNRGSYAVGFHAAYMSGSGPKANKKNQLIVKNNIIKGGKRAISITVHNKSKFGTVKVSANKAYCKKGKKEAISVGKKTGLKVTVDKKNKTYNWK